MSDSYKLTHEDYLEIINYAKSQYVLSKNPISVSGKLLHGDDAIKILLIDSVNVLLNKKGLLNKTVVIDER